jgi:alpha-amylase
MKKYNSKVFLTAALTILITLISTTYALAGVMMQGFYWDIPSDGAWWNTMASKAYALRYMVDGYGIDRIWFPPAYKGHTGLKSMGYDPHDYYDLGAYYQHSTTNTRFGSQKDLKTCIALYHSYGVSCMEDIVLNHRSGGDSEWNPYANVYTYTNFSNTASGMCQWDYNSFHPNGDCTRDEDTFSGMPDICYQSGKAYNDMKTWLCWLMDSENAGFDSWRFDFVKAYPSWVTRDMITATGGYGIGEYWDGSVSAVETWVTATTNCAAFDFPLYYTMANICNDTSGGGYLPNVFDRIKSYAAKAPDHAVTFAANHDLDTITNDKMLAYAFILTYQGYPCIFWKDYFTYGLASGGGAGTAGWGNGIKQLVWCREKLGGGAPNIEILKSDDGDYIIYGSIGTSSSSPGYIVIINDNAASWKKTTIKTGNSYLKGKILKAYAWSSTVNGQNYQPNNQACDSNGYVQVCAPPRGYAVFAPNGL